MRMNLYAQMRNNQNNNHQEKGRHRINNFNTRDEYYYYYYYDIERFEVDMIPYEDEAFQNIEPVELKATISEQDDAPTPK